MSKIIITNISILVKFIYFFQDIVIFAKCNSYSKIFFSPTFWLSKDNIKMLGIILYQVFLIIKI